RLDAFIQNHGDVRTQRELNFRGALRRQEMLRAVQVRTEPDALVGNLSKLGETEDLIAARIREDRAVPGHEAVQAAERADQFMPGAQIQMIRVGEDELRAKFLERFVAQPFDRGLRADGHKDGRFDGTVRSREHTAAGAGAVGLQHLEGEAHLSSVSGEDKCKSRSNELPHGPNNECDSDGAPRFQFTWIESSKPDSNQNKDPESEEIDARAKSDQP